MFRREFAATMVAVAGLVLCGREAAAQVCPAAPNVGCRTSEFSQLKIKDRTDNNRDRITWGWIRGEQTVMGEFGNPVGITDYTLCIYAGTAQALVDEDFAQHGSAWDFDVSRQKWFYRYRPGGDAADVQKIVLSGGQEGEARILWQGRGQNVTPATLPLPLPVVVQMNRSADTLCWESAFAVAKVNRQGAFKALGGPR